MSGIKKGADPDIFYLQIESIADLTGAMDICAPELARSAFGSFRSRCICAQPGHAISLSVVGDARELHLSGVR